MTVMYATVTSKGQVTLPAQLRRLLDIQAGQTVGFRLDGGQVTLEAASNVDEVRTMLEQAARRRGTWRTTDGVPQSWRDEVVARHAGS